MRGVSRPLLAAATLAVVLLTGCADPGGGAASGGDAGGRSDPGTGRAQDDPSGGTLPAPTTAPDPSAPAVPADVEIIVDDGAGTVTTYTLTCEPDGGDHPDPTAACSALAAGASALAPPDPDQACTEIYGGPQVATVTGTVEGAAVSSTFSRGNGCEIARWDTLASVFGPVTGVK